MVFNPHLFNKITRGHKITHLAESLGLDQDDFANDSPEDMLQKVVSAKEYTRMKQEVQQHQKSNNYTVPEIPKPEEVVYRKVGLDEYRIDYRRSKGTYAEEGSYPPLGAEITPGELFEGNDFARKQMPAIFEDAAGNLWTRQTKES